MDINELTIGQAKELATLFKNQRPEPSSIGKYAVGKKCIIRTYAAGVFFGEVAEREGQELVLKNARRIWSWSGNFPSDGSRAFTLSAVAQDGIKSGKLSRVEPEKLVLQVIEISPCSDKAIKQLEEAKAHDPS